ALRVGEYLMEEMPTSPLIKEVRGRGLMIGIEFHSPIAEIREKLLSEEHIFTGVAGQNMIRLLPPLTLTLDEADVFLNSFRKVLEEFENK
ncbi:MAG: aminotransferase class III-fold pyridoxal phosphate-dependent enzyme, partial [Prevotella sp.]|nr:aminotransferase class III-fold pyridoxal phosphate-dependent enzyme [Prevotella sp.]